MSNPNIETTVFKEHSIALNRIIKELRELVRAVHFRTRSSGTFAEFKDYVEQRWHAFPEIGIAKLDGGVWDDIADCAWYVGCFMRSSGRVHYLMSTREYVLPEGQEKLNLPGVGQPKGIVGPAWGQCVTFHGN